MHEALPAGRDPWIEAMRRGDFAAALRVSDRVLAERSRSGADCTNWPRHLQFIWTGAPLEEKRVLVRCYHGLGDTLQFVRFLAGLRDHAAEVILWAQPALLTLLQTVRGIDRLLPLHDGRPDADYDVDIELMELMHALRVTPGDLPGNLPYIYIAPSTPLPSFGPSTRNIGICWSAGEWGPDRSIPAASLQPLARLPDIQWFSLQYPPASCPLPAVQMACRDIPEMAARMQRLELVITVDTMVAHLAGALGLPVWLLLPRDADWRWMRERRDTPWYPTMSLFRQRHEGEWRTVIKAVCANLADAQHRARDIRSAGYRASSG